MTLFICASNDTIEDDTQTFNIDTGNGNVSIFTEEHLNLDWFLSQLVEFQSHYYLV